MVEMLKSESDVHDVILNVISIPSLKKTGNPYNDRKITKHVTIEGKIGKSYNTEKVIDLQNKGQMVEETGYVAKPRTWGTLINPYTVEHKGNYYLQVFVDKTSEPFYMLDDGIINESLISEWLQKKSGSEDIKIRDIKFENIKKMTFKNEEYLIS